MTNARLQQFDVAQPARRYSVFGLVVDSQIPLPDLYAAQPSEGDADVTIRLASPTAAEKAQDVGFKARGSETALLAIRNVGSYHITGGREIVVDPDRDVTERNLRLYLLGSAFGALLHQRGILPLHANAIELGGKAVAFCGPSRAGKSTLAAWFYDQGYRMISDDVCAITFDPARKPVVQGGLPRLRLCPDALVASGRKATDYAQSFDGVDKYDVPAPAARPGRPVALGAIYLLQNSEPGAMTNAITRLKGVEAVGALMANTYRGSFLKEMGASAQNLTACISLVETVPVFAAARSWGFDAFQAQAQALESHALRQMRSLPEC